jgi:hypothetical protein
MISENDKFKNPRSRRRHIHIIGNRNENSNSRSRSKSRKNNNGSFIFILDNHESIITTYKREIYDLENENLQIKKQILVMEKENNLKQMLEMEKENNEKQIIATQNKIQISLIVISFVLVLSHELGWIVYIPSIFYLFSKKYDIFRAFFYGSVFVILIYLIAISLGIILGAIFYMAEQKIIFILDHILIDNSYIRDITSWHHNRYYYKK